MDAARVAGDTAWMRQLHTTVATTTWDPAVRTATGAITASAMSRAGLQRRAMDVIVRVMRELPTDDHRRALVLAGAAALVAQSSGLGEHRRRLADLLTYVQTRPVDRTDPARRSLVGELPWDDLLTLVRVTHDPYYRAPVGPDPHPVAAEPTALVVRAAIREARGELAPAVELRWAAFLRSRGRGRLAADPEVWPALADGLLGVGRWADAEAVLEAATAAGAGDGLPLMQQELLSVRALLLAYRGEGEAARALVDQAWSVLDLAENRRLQARLVRAAGVAALARGDYSEAYRRHRLLFERDADPPLAELASASLIELVGSAVRAERTAEVDALLVEIPRYRRLEVGHGARHPAAVRTASASLSLLSAAADGTLPGLWPLERALAQLHHGELLRRQRQRAAARVPLRAALEFFDRLGARVLADAARAELGATGGGLSGAGAARHSPAALELPLTPQQREVALLAAEGLRNREIAERLMVSPRTVGAHLQATYARLGITSRRQLRAAITGHDYALLGASEPS
jgi:DNA-binding NarL/FixJ family response regulator